MSNETAADLPADGFVSPPAVAIDLGGREGAGRRKPDRRLDSQPPRRIPEPYGHGCVRVMDRPRRHHRLEGTSGVRGCASCRRRLQSQQHRPHRRHRKSRQLRRSHCSRLGANLLSHIQLALLNQRAPWRCSRKIVMTVLHCPQSIEDLPKCPVSGRPLRQQALGGCLNRHQRPCRPRFGCWESAPSLRDTPSAIEKLNQLKK